MISLTLVLGVFSLRFFLLLGIAVSVPVDTVVLALTLEVFLVLQEVSLLVSPGGIVLILFDIIFTGVAWLKIAPGVLGLF